MRSSIAILILALTASQVMSACFGPSTLTAILTGTTGATLLAGDVVAAAGTAVDSTAASSKCFATAATKICAKDATAEGRLVADIQTYVTAQKTAMETASGVRDAYIIEKRGEVITILASLRRLNDLQKNSKFTIPTAFLTFGTAFIGYADTIAANFTAIVENFADYQTQRVKCMDALLKTQAGLLCTAFLETAPTGITHHATASTVALADTFLATLSGECFNYVSYSVRQSSIIITAAYSKGLANLVTGIEALASSDATAAATALGSAFTTFGTVTYSATPSQVPAKTPSTVGSACTATSCAEWIEDLFSPALGVLVQEAAVRGGEAVTAFTYTPSRVLSEGKERRLAASGVTITLANYAGFASTAFKTNPGSVDNTKNANSALRNGIVAVAVAALALVF